ncbi:pilus assembly protein FimV [Marinomonas sp. M1K-6]|uniref:Pilus assembly protein FimV n=1 Tax=Marinomonas profundi TaxID=2726122 RepID=A0A847RF80_9GAMM|nr:FimV/HubP family polar landmark protein [Marinomonas profundi]NLQ18920.1 pilus assembly protein FimV [Marinomonas profundi]UDV02857.1 pilus assembly protein FimV [Marinomonas profundi]
MLRKTLISIAVSSALYVSSSYALELGELTSQSNLDEPYRGSIELSDVGSLTDNDILIRLGSESEFRQAGFAPTRVLSQLKFDIARNNGNLIVAVSSEQPLRVDELRFVLAARWPSGQVVREYQTPLNQSALVNKSQADVVQTAPVSRTSSEAGRVFRQATVAAEKMPSNGRLNVSKGNTLWSIAGQNNPTNQLTIYQTMMAIQALNKDAFYSDNINLLKEGAVLRLPTQEQIALFNQSIAKEEFQRQHDAWVALKGNAGRSAVSQAQMNTQAKAKGAAANAESGSDKLTLASGQSMLPENAAGSNTGDGKGGVDALQNELSATQETLDKEQREKAELSSQLGDLSEQLATLEQLISLKDKQLADLQQQFASAQQALQEQKNTVDQLLEADQIRREKELAEADSLVNKIFGNPIVVSIGAVVLLLLGFLIGLVMRRAGKKQEEQDSLKKNEFDLSSAAVVAPVAAVAAADYLVEDEVDEKTDVDEEDPFAFDFGGSDDDFDSFDAEIASADLVDPDIEEDIDFLEEQEDVLESATDESAADEDVTDDDSIEDIFASFGETDDLAESADDLVNDLETGAEGDDIPTMGPESMAPNDSAEKDVEDMTVESEEESFVSSLLNDVEQDDVDEASIFSGTPDESLANAIEETLAEAQDESDEMDVPAFGETEAAEDEEVSDDEEEFDFFDASGDEVATKLDLARAYMDMGDEEGARVILDDVIDSGNEKQIAEAQNMMERMFPSD